jgi:hypothetical protein
MDDRELERELRETLRRTQAPAGFSARVFERTSGKAAAAAWWRRPALAWSLASVLLVSAVGGTEAWHAHHERVEGERAKAELMLALRITGQKIQFAQSKLRGE